jgi:hypothetical protein
MQIPCKHNRHTLSLRAVEKARSAKLNTVVTWKSASMIKNITTDASTRFVDEALPNTDSTVGIARLGYVKHGSIAEGDVECKEGSRNLHVELFLAC